MLSPVYIRSAGAVTREAAAPPIPPPIAAGELPPGRVLPAAGWIDPVPRPGARMPRFGRLDRLAQLSLVAAARAVEAADAPALKERTPASGVALGSHYASHLSNELFWRGMRGASGPSPALFAYTLPSAATAEVSMFYGLTGPALTLVGSADSGLAALASAARCVASGQASCMLAGAADVLSPGLLLALGAGAVPLEEAAVFALLAADPERCLARLAGSGQASGEAALAGAIGLALEEAGLRAQDLRVVVAAEETRLPPTVERYSERRGLAAAPLLASLEPLREGALPCMVVAGGAGSATALCWTLAR